MNTQEWRSAESQKQPGSNRDPVSPVGRMLLAGFRAVGFLVKVLAVALAISMAAGQLAGFLGFLLPGVKSWQLSGYGWVTGAVLAIIGIPAGWVKLSFSNKSKASAAVERAPGAATGEPAGLAGRMAAGALTGAFIFSFVAGMMVMCWFSLGRCPFLPESWKYALGMPAALTSSGGGAGIQLTGDDAWLPVQFILGALILGAVCGALLLISFRGGRVIWRNGPFARPF